MKYRKIIIVFIFTFTFIFVFRVNVLAYNIKSGEVYVGYDSYTEYITPNQLISSSIEYYKNTKSTQEFKIYQYINDTWLVYNDKLKVFASNDTFDLERLEFNKIINQVNKYFDNLTEDMIKNKNSFTYNGKYYFLLNDLKEQGINYDSNMNGYIIYKNKNIIGYDIEFNNKKFRKIEASDVINVKDYGAIGDGINDDTYSIQNAVKEINKTGGILYFPNGKYIMEVKTGWTSKKHYESLININTDKKVIIEFDGSTIKMQDGRKNSDGTKNNDNLLSHYIVLNIEESSDVTVQNGKLVGDRIEHCYYTKDVNNKEDCTYKTVSSYYYPTHEFGFGINIYNKTTDNPKKIVIDNMDISDMIGDCITVDDINNSADITIKNSELYKSRRQGISILEVNKILVKNTKIHDIGHADGVNGTSPMSGIDIEPGGGSKNAAINSITFDKLNISNNSSFGIITGSGYISAINNGNGKDKENGIGYIDIYNSYIEGLVAQQANINNSTINNKLGLNTDNSGTYYTKKYISGSSLNVYNSIIKIYDNRLIDSKANNTFGITNSNIDDSDIIITESDLIKTYEGKIAINLRETKLTNSYLKNGRFTIKNVTTGNNMKLAEGSGNNTYEDFYIYIIDDSFVEIGSTIKNSSILTHGNQSFNTMIFNNDSISHTYVNGNSVEFNNCNFDNVDISRFYNKEFGTYYLNGKSLNKKCIFNYKDNNNCFDN